jgi:cell division protein FtsA
LDEIIEARLEELFDMINKELQRAGRAGKLPSGVVLVGGTAKLKGIAEYAKNKLNLAVQIGKIEDYGSVVDDIREPQFATAIGLMLIDSELGAQNVKNSNNMFKTKKKVSGGVDRISKFLGRFRI